MKQTVEQAAKAYYDPYSMAFPNNEVAFAYGAQFGASWQREQGIGWIKLSPKTYPSTRKVFEGVESEFSEPVLIWKEGESPQIGVCRKTNDMYIFHHDKPWQPTHYAYITLPKTDNNG